MSRFPTNLHPRHRIIERAKNTFLYTPWWYLPKSRSPEHWANQVQRAMSFTKPTTLLGRLWNRLERILGLSIADLSTWANQSFGAYRDPSHFVELDLDDTVLIDEVAKRASDLNVPILDLGCNCGRHLNELFNRGFTNLYGVDVGKKALDYMDELFPDMSTKTNITNASFQQYLLQTPDRFFEILYTKGSTVELVHPAFPLVKHITRVARSHAILCIHESVQTYPRLWTYEFEREGFVLIKLLRPVVEPPVDAAHSLMVYRRVEFEDA